MFSNNNHISNNSFYFFNFWSNFFQTTKTQFVFFVLFSISFFWFGFSVSEAFLLKFLLFWMLLQCVITLLIPKNSLLLLKEFSFTSSCYLFVASLLLYFRFFNASLEQGLFGHFQFITELSFLSSNTLNIGYTVGIDGISIFFLLLTTLLTPICLLISWNAVKYRVKEFFFLMLVIEFCVFNVFLVTDLFFFFVAFESVLLPMFFVIGVWGSRQRKLHAVFQFFIYTLFGSVFLLLGIFIIFFEVGSTNYHVLLNYNFNIQMQLILFLLFFLAFAIKVPMFPFHIWLPEAHVEAPTAGSVILAGLLLKLGTYGFIRFLIPMFPDACSYFTPLVYTMCVIAIVYTSLTTIRQIDLKKIIAYSSVGHMNYVILGLFTTNMEGVAGSIYLMLSHGIVSSALFICIGMLYDRYKTRNIFYYRSLIQYMPVFGVFFIILTLANVSFPGTSSFVGEFLILIGVFENNVFVALIGTFSIIFGMIYSFWLYNRIMFGSSTKPMEKFDVFFVYSDLSLREFFVLFILIFFVFLGGFCPNIFLDKICVSTNAYINLYSSPFYGL